METIKVTNNGTAPLVMGVYLKDWERDSLGTKQYLPASSTNHSNASWIHYSPSQLTIAPGETKALDVQLKAPQNATAFTNSMLFLTQINKQDTLYRRDANGKGMGIIIKLEVGIHIYNATPALNPTKDINFLRLKEIPSTVDSLRQFETVLKNQGEDYADVTIGFNLTEVSTGQKYNLAPSKISMLPGAAQAIKFQFPSQLPKGTYQIVVMADAGDNSALQIAKKQISYE